MSDYIVRATAANSQDPEHLRLLQPILVETARKNS